MELSAIPGTLGFLASRDGIVFGPDGEKRVTYTNGDGYLTTSVKLTCGKWQTFGVQRLIALAWKECPGDPNDFTVNHIDTDITNNDERNLEWLTVADNNLHASLMRRTVERPTIYGINPAGEYFFLDNLYAAAELLAVDISLAWDMVRCGLMVGGYTLYPITNRTILPPQLRAPTIKERNSAGRVPDVPVRVKNIEDGTFLLFDTINAAARHFSVSASHICQCISGVKPRLFKRKYVIANASVEFPDTDSLVLKRNLDAAGKTTWGWNTADGNMYVTSSASQLIKLTGLSKKAVTTRLQRHGYGEIGEWVFAYEENLKPLLDRVKGSSLP